MRAPGQVLRAVSRRERRVGKPPLTAVGRRKEFRRLLEEHDRRYVPDGTGAEPVLARALADFARDGVAFLPGFLPPDVVATVAEEGWRAARPLMEGGDPGPLRTREWPGGPLRIYDLVDGPVPSVAAFFDHPFVTEFAARTTTAGMHVLDEYLDVKYEIDGADTNVTVHFDQWKVRLKFFLLLGDVGEDQAPFVYYLGSQRPGRWRVRADRRFARTGFAQFPADRVAALMREHGFERRVFTGRAGDLLIADTRGLHSASVLRAGERLQAVRLYGMDGPESWAG